MNNIKRVLYRHTERYIQVRVVGSVRVLSVTRYAGWVLLVVWLDAATTGGVLGLQSK